MRSRSFSRSIALGALFLLALPAVGQAQTARVEGLALQGDYLKDYTGIFTYPSQVPNVGNLVYGELGRFVAGSSVDRGVGAVLGNLWDGRFGVWGLHLRQFTPALGQGDLFTPPNPGIGGGDPNFNSNESIDLMWGRKMGTTSFGLRFNRSFFKSEDALPGVVTSVMEFDALRDTANFARNIMGIGAGAGFELNPNTNVEFTFLYQSRTFEETETRPAGVVSEEEDNPGTFLIGARAMWQWQPNVLVIPVFRFHRFDLSTESSVGGTTTSADNTLSGWQAGVSGNWTLGTNDLFVLGGTVASNRLEQEDDIFGIAASVPTPAGGTPIGDELEAKETIMPLVFAALETHVNNWLTLRMGARKGMFHKLEIEETGGSGRDIEVNLSSFLMNIGAGVKLGTLQLDAVLNSTFPQTLGGFFSQTSDYITFPKVTATYSF
jgi:hypothetical protein